jgi:hypothetical protein
MNHTISPISVFQTSDYSRFHNIHGNRDLNKNKIRKIMKEIRAGNDILDQVPVLVSIEHNKLLVYDGQHRIEIAKQLRRPVHYIIRPKMTLHDVAKVNSNVEKWKPQDFINCYIAAGNSNYKKIDEFKINYELPLSISLVLLAKGIINSEGGKELLKEQFEKGIFEVKKWKQAVEVAEACKRFSLFDAWNSGGFAVAICKIIGADKCDFEELVKKFKEDTLKLHKQSSAKAYLVNLEEIYNKGYSKRRVIF